MGRVWSLLLCLALGWTTVAWTQPGLADEPVQTTPDGNAPAASDPDEPKVAPPDKAAPDKAAPEKAAPEKAAPEKAAPEKAAPEKAAPEKAAPEEEAPNAKAAPGAKSGDASSDDAYDLYQSFADTIDQVERNYVKKVDRRQLMEAAIHGVLSKLDPYSNYIGPEDMARFKSSVENQFGGIGIQIAIEHDKLSILSPMFGSPAYRAGLESGDHIVEIEGRSTEGLSIDDAIRQLKGEAGTSVTFAVIHPGQTKKEVVTIKREIIHVDTVLGDSRKADDHWDFMLDHDKHIGYVRITGFGRDTARDLKAALEELKAQGLAGLVIDLRFNPGGLLTSAIEISDMFISTGRIVSTKGRNTPERAWEATREGTYEGFPVAVLVNHYSASASEIFSACMQDHHRAVIIGERTWGKGSVQNIIDLENGRSALKLTTASYQRPSGKNIHRFPDAKETDEWGVMPDKGFDCHLTDERETVDLMRYRRQRDILRSHKPPLAVAASDVLKPAAGKPAVVTPAQGTIDAPPVNPEAPPEKAVDAEADDDARHGNAKPDASKPEATQPAETQPAETQPAETQPAETKPIAPESGSNAKPDASKPDDVKPGVAKPVDAKSGDGDHDVASVDHPFVDRQLQKALDYLSHEMAGAPAAVPEPKRE